MRKVFITGMGAITPLGPDLPASFNRLMTGEGAIGEAPAAVKQWLPDAIAARIDDSFDERLGRQERTLDRATKFALLAAREAMADATLSLTEEEKDRAGVFSGIGMGGAATLDQIYERFYKRLHRVDGETGNPTVVHPFTVPTAMANASVAWLSILGGMRGPTQTYSVACSSSAVALGEAYRAIKHGYAEVIVVVGTEAMLLPGPFVAWNALRVMASRAQDNIAASCRPFSRDRCGFVLGEGAAALVLESEERVRRDGRRCYAEFSGYGMSSDASHITMPSTDGQIRAIRRALDDARCAPESIGYINAHGTATDAGDISETNAIKQVFGDHAHRLAVSSTKSMHGHLIGGAGALEFAIAVKALERGCVPPTAYLTDVDPRCDLDYVPQHGRECAGLSAVISNSFAFGGTNVSLVARAPTH
ncbi:beta-ketoacyl-[acyl-carrier-protein] synthase family protein [Tahibacter amnicola]|uniref:Nodulation protein E n=1 Tax=Tahibacter amnicola TaxID=2976241 RepID=A0ABY6B9G9_9GAMM|nr:beta-ketoacyl-[acyl-carrier-protein] synthase family protein [Tahibacter amnicola]UXI66181.1 beta-ketoacyl-[acyl-carrier-protein] synthase family protein [Tahibacter amnicola]